MIRPWGVLTLALMVALACAPAEQAAPKEEPVVAVAPPAVRTPTPEDASPTPAPEPASPTPGPEVASPTPAPEPASPPPEPEPEPEPEPMPAWSPLDSRLPLVTSPLPPFPSNKLPRWCSVTQRIAPIEEIGTLADALRLSTGEPDGTEVDLCGDLSSCDKCSCPEGGPWLMLQEKTLELSLVVPLGSGRFGHITDLGYQSDGTEESELVIEAPIHAPDPLSVSILRYLSEESCDDHDESLCGLFETARVYDVITELPDGRVLVTRIEIDVARSRSAEERMSDPMVELTHDSIRVSACDRNARVGLPPDWIARFEMAERLELEDEGDAAEPPAPAARSEGTPARLEGAPAEPETVKQAAQLCNTGWTELLAGEIDAAAVDIDVALRVLERATDERGRRSLGACLYNRGRVAEARAEVEEARGFYRRSLDVRPNDTVARRLEGLE